MKECKALNRDYAGMSTNRTCKLEGFFKKHTQHYYYGEINVHMSGWAFCLLCFILQVVSGKVGEWVAGYVHYTVLVSYYFNVICVVTKHQQPFVYVSVCICFQQLLLCLCVSKNLSKR